MTSTITATVRPNTTLEDIFGALFPCGSVTGAPKIKAMELIARFENEPRGIYCGAIGLLRPGGDAVFNVAIRTVTIDSESETATCGVGSGIVWDSSASGEYDETLLKSQFLDGDMADFELLETLRLVDGKYARLELHLARLASSARRFGRPFDMGGCLKELNALAAKAEAQPVRVRILLDRVGKMRLAASSMPALAIKPAFFAIANKPVSRDDIWLYHKTTRRTVYDQALASFPDAFDVLLWNEQGELTEFTRGNLILEVDNRKLTPTLKSGLLDGCLRREMLNHDEIREATLTLDDLPRAQRVWFINSLRGCIEMQQIYNHQEHRFPIPS